MPGSDSRFAIHSRKPLSVAIAVFLIALLTMGLAIWKLEKRDIEAERLRYSVLAGNHAYAIQISMERALSATYAVAAVVRQNKGQVTDFEGLGKEMLPLYPGISSMALAPGGVVRYVAPLEGNQRAIGLDQLNDPRQGSEGRRARDSGQLTLAGPLELRQGGIGVVGRLPIFVPSNTGKPEFWGLISVIIRLPQALANIHLEQLKTEGLHYELFRIHPETNEKFTIAHSGAAALDNPVLHSLTVPNGTWTLAVTPIAGWGSNTGLAFNAMLALLCSLLLAYATKLLVELNKNRAGQEALVVDRTREVTASQAKLQATLDAIPDLILEVSLDGTFHEYRAPRMAAHYPASDFFLGHTAAAVLPAEAAFALLTALRQAEQNGHSDGQEIFIDEHGERRWFEISVSRKQGGPTDDPRFIVLARDSSQRKQAETELRVAATAFDSQLGMAITDVDQLVLRINKAFTDITGYTESDVLGRTMSFLDSDRHEPAFFENMLATVRATGAWRGEIWNRRKSGQVFPVHHDRRTRRRRYGHPLHQQPH